MTDTFSIGPKTFQSLARVVSSTIGRPRHGKVPHALSELVILAFTLVPASVVLITLLVHTSIVSGWPSIFAFTALCILGDSMVVQFAPKIQMSYGDLFLAIAFVALSPASAALIVCSLVVVAAVTTIESWDEALGKATFTAAGALAGLGACQLTLHYTPASNHALLPLAVLMTLIGMSIAELSLMALVDFFAPQSNISLQKRMKNAGSRVGGLWVLVLVQIIAQAPMVILGVLAYRTWHPYVFLALVPYLVMWQSGHKEAKLIEAERKIGIDALTGLMNRDRFFRIAQDEITTSRRYNHPLALIMGDLDNFKRINDHLGHIVGDQALMSTADAMRQVCDEGNIPVGRYGGEEFTVLIPASSQRHVCALAERLRIEVEKRLEPWESSISLGIAYLETGDDLESFIDRADKALYSAKFAGKNTVVEWTKSLRPPAQRPAA